VKTQRLLVAAAFLFALGAVATYLVALHTARGLHDDAALYARVAGNGLAPVKAAGVHALATIDIGSLAAAALVLCFLAFARGRTARAVAAGALIAVSVGSVELLKHGLPHIVGAIPSGRPATFPSGHTSVAVSLGLALVLAVPPVLRPTAALVGASYAAGIALSVIVLGWHYPSDAVGSFFICGFWACIAGVVSGGVARRPAVSVPGLLSAVVIVALGLFAAAFLASRHPYAVAAVRSRESLIATAAALGVLSLGTFGVLMPLFDEDGCADDSSAREDRSGYAVRGRRGARATNR
jgi:membrane-associated phospholipid phosphatase